MANSIQGVEPGNEDAPAPGAPDGGLHERVIPGVAEDPRADAIRRRRALILLASLALVVILMGVLVSRLIHVRKASEHSGLATAPTSPTVAAAQAPKRFTQAFPVEPGAAAGVVVPAVDPRAAEVAPIAVTATGPRAPTRAGATTKRDVDPEDAPVLISRDATAAAGLPGTHLAGAGAAQMSGAAAATGSTPAYLAQVQADLEASKHQLQGVLSQLQGGAGAANAGASSAPQLTQLGALQPASPGPGEAFNPNPPPSGVTGKPRAQALFLGDRSLVMPKGTTFTCALTTQIVSAVSGPIGCQVLRNIYSDNGRVLLVERGSHIDGEYAVTQVQPGMTRVPAIWTRIRTPSGVVVELDSKGAETHATGPLGQGGVGGSVDNRWGERLSAALLVSFIDSALQITVNSSQPSNSGNSVVLGNATQSSGKLAEKVLESTINIPPLIYTNQGGVVGVYTAQDIDFSGVYALAPTSP
jgi:type IV secretion system protein VirB10